jgi:hypothetical protein
MTQKTTIAQHEPQWKTEVNSGAWEW